MYPTPLPTPTFSSVYLSINSTSFPFPEWITLISTVSLLVSEKYMLLGFMVGYLAFPVFNEVLAPCYQPYLPPNVYTLNLGMLFPTVIRKQKELSLIWQNGEDRENGLGFRLIWGSLSDSKLLASFLVFCVLPSSSFFDPNLWFYSLWMSISHLSLRFEILWASQMFLWHSFCCFFLVFPAINYWAIFCFVLSF